MGKFGFKSEEELFADWVHSQRFKIQGSLQNSNRMTH